MESVSDVVCAVYKKKNAALLVKGVCGEGGGEKENVSKTLEGPISLRGISTLLSLIASLI